MNPQLHIVKASLLVNHCHLEHIFGREFYIYLHINPFTVQIKFKNKSIKKSIADECDHKMMKIYKR